MTDVVSLEFDGPIAHAVLNRPEKGNAINLDMLRAIEEVSSRIAAEARVRCVVLGGAGEHFCTGIDMAMFGELDATLGADALAPRSPSPANLFQKAAWAWRALPVPVICAISGVAYGGGLQIALGADIRYAAPSARLSVMEVKWGLIPDMAISATTRDIVPLDRVRELAYTGRVIAAQEALAMGLVTGLHEDPLAAALAAASEIAGRSPDAVRAMKSLFEQAWSLPVADALALEARLQLEVIGKPNQREAVAANLEKRVPRFTD